MLSVEGSTAYIDKTVELSTLIAKESKTFLAGINVIVPVELSACHSLWVTSVQSLAVAADAAGAVVQLEEPEQKKKK